MYTRSFPYLALALLTVAVTACTKSQDAAPATQPTDAEIEAGDPAVISAELVTLSGTLVDTKCYGMNPQNVGNNHDGMAKCGTACAGMGIPAGVLADGNVHVIIAPATGLAEHISKEFRVTGTPVFESSILPATMEVRSATGDWTKVATATMM